MEEVLKNKAAEEAKNGGKATEAKNGGKAAAVAEVVAANAGAAGKAGIEEMLEEDRRRRKALRGGRYDPVRGVGCCEPRKWAVSPEGSRCYVPVEMAAAVRRRRPATMDEWNRLRVGFDFEFWAATCSHIKNKTTAAIEPFRLNRPQRRVLQELERMRQAGEPIRIIILKARQWGGSTLILHYMAWIQLAIVENWNSLVCAHVKDTAGVIRGMYSLLVDRYPEGYVSTGDGKKLALRAHEGSRNTRLIAGRGATITIGSSESQDAIRGCDFAMAHLSEVAFWRDSNQQSPEAFIRAIYGSINSRPNTLIALESTANGVGNFFHREWLRAEAGESDKLPVFVPWTMIEIYANERADRRRVIAQMDEYEWGLWRDHGCTLAQIAWFQKKRREYPTLASMLAEYPTTAVEAFSLTSNNVFTAEHCERLRRNCEAPGFVGEIASTRCEDLEPVEPTAAAGGRLSIWRRPEGKASDYDSRYVAAVDVGGRSRNSDWSVVTVIDRFGGADGSRPEVVAQWRGHDDHDRLAVIASNLALYYNRALLVFESNTFETETWADDPASFILNEVADYYPNLYYRPTEGGGLRVGFHTNRATKSAIINRLIALVRDDGYVERDSMAVNELLSYETTAAGGYEARRGCHDDILMSRAIALYVAATLPGIDEATEAAWEGYSERFEPELQRRVARLDSELRNLVR